MKRVIITVGAALVAAVPATMGFLGNSSFSQRVPVRVPVQAVVVQDDGGQSAQGNAADDKGGRPATDPAKVSGNKDGGRIHIEPGDDKGGATTHVEPGDDKRGATTHVEPGDDKRGATTTSTVKASPRVSPQDHSAGATGRSSGGHSGTSGGKGVGKDASGHR